MNLIAHFYLDLNRANSYFVVGAASPDLLSIYNSNLRIKARHLRLLDEEQAGRINPPFLAGLQRHFFADGVFHTSPNFFAQTKRISNLLVEYFPDQDIQKKFFIAHILLELLIDKILIDQHPGILESYYGHFESLLPFKDIKQSLHTAMGHDLHNYEGYMQRFLRRKYLYDYARYDHIAWVLKRILRRVRLDNSDYVSTNRFRDLMAAYEAELAEQYEVFFSEIRAAED